MTTLHDGAPLCTNLIDIYQARPSAPPPPESHAQALAISLITERHVENERLQAERRKNHYAVMLEALNPKCITTVSDRTGGHQCRVSSVVGSKYCKRHLDGEVCRRRSTSPHHHPPFVCLHIVDRLSPLRRRSTSTLPRP
jgi:hypothetical protein